MVAVFPDQLLHVRLVSGFRKPALLVKQGEDPHGLWDKIPCINGYPPKEFHFLCDRVTIYTVHIVCENVCDFCDNVILIFVIMRLLVKSTLRVLNYGNLIFLSQSLLEEFAKKHTKICSNTVYVLFKYSTALCRVLNVFIILVPAPHIVHCSPLTLPPSLVTQHTTAHYSPLTLYTPAHYTPSPLPTLYLLNEVDGGLQIEAKVDEGPLDALYLVLLLLQLKHSVVEELLQLLIGVVDAQLLKGVELQRKKGRLHYLETHVYCVA